MAHANIRALGFILTLAALVLRAILAVVPLRVTLLPLKFALFLLARAFAVPAGLVLILVNKCPAAGSDRLRELGSSSSSLFGASNHMTCSDRLEQACRRMQDLAP